MTRSLLVSHTHIEDVCMTYRDFRKWRMKLSPFSPSVQQPRERRNRAEAKGDCGSSAAEEKRLSRPCDVNRMMAQRRPQTRPWQLSRAEEWYKYFRWLQLGQTGQTTDNSVRRSLPHYMDQPHSDSKISETWLLEKYDMESFILTK